jgi:hypothetical protein
MVSSIQIVVDCADPAALAAFWATALGYKLQDPPDGFASWPEWLEAQGVPEEQWNSASAVVDPDGDGPRLFLQQVPEPKTAKNRWHLDLNVSGGPSVPLEERQQRVTAEAERLVAAGATLVGFREKLGDYWAAMLDPEGNEFDIQ